MPTSKENELAALISKKDSLFRRIQILYDESRKLNTPASKTNFKIRFNSLEGTRKQFEGLIDRINVLSLEIVEAYAPNYAALEALEDMYCHIIENAKNNLPEVFNSGNAASSHSIEDKAAIKPTARLPKIDIIEFSGDMKDWPIFYETFKALIHENSDLNEVTKLHYLLGKLTGKALTVCSGIQPCGTNYSVIWDTLVQKYQDIRLLADSYLTQILEFKPAQNESAACLHAFLEKFDTAVNALKQLESSQQIANLGDYLFAFLALSKLDSVTHRTFEGKRADKTRIPQYADVVNFVKEQAKILTCMGKVTHASAKASSSHLAKPKSIQSFVVNYKSGQSSESCPICKSTHALYQCKSFSKLVPTARFKLAKEHALCLNCLSSSHKLANCKSRYSCSVCNLRHHSLLHFNKSLDATSTGKPTEEGTEAETSKTTVENSFHAICLSNSKVFEVLPKTVMLSTAVVEVISPIFGHQRARFLVDTGSESHFISWKCCERLKLPITKSYSSVMGIGAVAKSSKGKTHFVIVSRVQPHCQYSLEAIVIDQITNRMLPASTVELNSLQHLTNLALADDQFYHPADIDGIIGAELFPLLIGSHKVRISDDLPIAMESTLGYLVMGRCPLKPTTNQTNNYCGFVEAPVENLLEKFWSIEEIPGSVRMTPDDLECEQIFVKETTRDATGRYTVALPFKSNSSELGASYSTALQRFLSLEKRFRQFPLFRQRYSDVMQDYIDQNHMSLVSKPDISKESGYHIPHHAIYKESSSTPVRVVFDASAKTSNSLSLNDVLHTGEKLQADVITVLLNFRLFPVALIADVRQMYRQIWLHPKHRQYQKILWRFSPEAPVDTYSINVVSFGVKSSPFLALRTVRQLAEDEAQNFPLAAVIASRDVYMDDVVTSASDEEEAISLFHQLVALFKAGGFELLKWASNSPNLVEIIPDSIRFSGNIDLGDEVLKVLGFQWHPQTDTLAFTINSPTGKCTKRNILSSIARIWDPLGLIAPVSLYAKLLIKQLWMSKSTWDEMAPPYIQKLWEIFSKELPRLSDFSIPRHLGINPNSKACCVGFADASQDGYGAVVYIRVFDERSSVVLTCAKARVAPIKTISVPRLELCAALLLAKLLKFVLETYQPRFQFRKVLALTDSEIVLAWINSSPHRWNTFIANRVTKIQELVAPKHWFHVRGCENPSDCLSRGLTPAGLLNHTLWLHGPEWLSLPENSWPTSVTPVQTLETNLEERKVACCSVHTEIDYFDVLLDRYSSLAKIKRIMAYVLRFVVRVKESKKSAATFTDIELHRALLVLVRHVQHQAFSKEIQHLQQNKLLPKAFRRLSIFLDSKGLLRVGGRLAQSRLPFETKHPALLPRQHRLTEMLIEDTHRAHLHPGPSTLMYLLSQNFWILSYKRAIRSCLGKCLRCLRLNPRPIVPPMGNLPRMRIQQIKPFQCVGIDYGGPFFITLGKSRGVKSQKAYLCLIVCCATKALHLELVSDLTAEACLAAFRRFIARRGRCTKVYSDGGTNFVGVNKELSRLFQNAASEERVEWNFNPPSAPHFGGLFEAGIKSVKTHLYRVIGSQILTYEELYTVFVQIEALLNSRPLCVASSDPNDIAALTPGHFLTMEPLTCIPDPDFTEVPISRLNRWQLLQRLHFDFWKRWHSEYLHSLQTKQKWISPVSSVKIGTLVVIKTENSRPLDWPLGIITAVFPGKDGVVRVACVKTKTGTYKRPVVKLCPLPVD